MSVGCSMVTKLQRPLGLVAADAGDFAIHRAHSGHIIKRSVRRAHGFGKPLGIVRLRFAAPGYEYASAPLLHTKNPDVPRGSRLRFLRRAFCTPPSLWSIGGACGRVFRLKETKASPLTAAGLSRFARFPFGAMHAHPQTLMLGSTLARQASFVNCCRFDIRRDRY